MTLTPAARAAGAAALTEDFSNGPRINATPSSMAASAASAAPSGVPLVS